MADTCYARMGDVFGTGHSANVFSLLSGPVFYPVQYLNTRIFVHTLAGLSVVDSAVPVSDGHYLSGALADSPMPWAVEWSAPLRGHLRSVSAAIICEQHSPTPVRRCGSRTISGL